MSSHRHTGQPGANQSTTLFPDLGAATDEALAVSILNAAQALKLSLDRLQGDAYQRSLVPSLEVGSYEPAVRTADLAIDLLKQYVPLIEARRAQLLTGFTHYCATEWSQHLAMIGRLRGDATFNNESLSKLEGLLGLQNWIRNVEFQSALQLAVFLRDMSV